MRSPAGAQEATPPQVTGNINIEAQIHQAVNFDADFNSRTNGININEKGDEITSSLYTFPFSGFHPLLLPLITTNSAAEPITILAYTNFTFFNSYIFLPLVEELGLTASIIPRPPIPPYAPERDPTSLFGFETKAIGTLNLDVLAGKNDRLVPGATFTVVYGPDPKGSRTDGWYLPDVVVGIDFLNGIDALRLGSEFSGARAAGARDGLGVVVQRVFEAGEQPHAHGRDEQDEVGGGEL